MKLMTAGELVASAIECEGINTVFGLIGSHTYGIYDALRQNDNIRHLSVRHESTASLAADAFSKVSGHTSVCILTAGPGALNSIAGVGQSYFSATPMVHISGAPQRDAPLETLHGADAADYTRQIFEPVTKRSLRPGNLEELRNDMASAFRIARSGRHGPVHLEIPLDLMEAEAAPVAEYIADIVPVTICPTDVIATVYAGILAAQRPLFCIDKGVVRCGESQRLLKLAEITGAAIAVTRDAIGAVPDNHHLYAGVVHDFNFGNAGFNAVESADFIVCFGYRPGSENLKFIEDRLQGRIFNFSFEDAAGPFEDGYSADLENIITTLEQVTAGQVERKIADWPQQRLSDQRQHIINKLELYAEQSPIHFGWALTLLFPYINSNTTVVLDAGSHEVWGRTILPVHGPASQIGSANWATMGYTLAGMIGARMASPDVPIVGISGDGCLLMSLSDLFTWLDIGGPSVLLVLNDSEYGMIAQSQDSRYGACYETSMPAVNFAEMTSVLGGTAYRVETPSQLNDAIDKAFAANRPVLIDVISQTRMDYPEWQ